MYAKAKMISVQTVPRIGGAGGKGELWRGRIQV
jgi:hypothetical protein